MDTVFFWFFSEKKTIIKTIMKLRVEKDDYHHTLNRKEQSCAIETPLWA